MLSRDQIYHLGDNDNGGTIQGRCECECAGGKRVKCFFDKMSTRELGPYGGEEDCSLIYNYVIQSKRLAVVVIYLGLERLRCFTIVFERNGVTGSD